MQAFSDMRTRMGHKMSGCYRFQEFQLVNISCTHLMKTPLCITQKRRYNCKMSCLGIDPRLLLYLIPDILPRSVFCPVPSWWTQLVKPSQSRRVELCSWRAFGHILPIKLCNLWTAPCRTDCICMLSVLQCWAWHCTSLSQPRRPSHTLSGFLRKKRIYSPMRNSTREFLLFLLVRSLRFRPSLVMSCFNQSFWFQGSGTLKWPSLIKCSISCLSIALCSVVCSRVLAAHRLPVIYSHYFSPFMLCQHEPMTCNLY